MSKEAVYGWDVEAVEWDRPVLAVVSSADGGETVYRGERCLHGVAEHMRDHPGTYFAHYGGGYDVPLLMNVRGFSEIVLSGTNILCAREGRGLQLCDTFPWWLASLKKVGEAVGVRKMEADRGDIGGMGLDDVEAYCKQDVRVLLAGVEACNAFLDAHGAQRRKTAGSSAVALERALEPGTWRTLISRRNPVEEVGTFLDSGAGRGGRIDALRRGIVSRRRGRRTGVTSVDVKSSYPARYAGQPGLAVGAGVEELDAAALGVALRELKAGRADTMADFGTYLARWEWHHRERVAPAVDHASQAGYGACEAWLGAAELRSLFAAGAARVELLRGFGAQEACLFGHAFAAVMFAAKEGGGPAAFFAKVFLNALLGKTLEHPIKERYTRWRPAEGEYVPELGMDVVGDRERRPDASWFRYSTVSVAADGRCEPHMQPVLGECCLSRARAALYDEGIAAMERAGLPVLYMDTDNVHVEATEAEVRDVLGDRCGVTLGKWNVEATGCDGYYLGPKAYLLVDADGNVVKQALKGIPLRSYAKGTIDADGLFREARKGEDGRDVRVRVFEDALDKGSVRCLKDGVSTFLRGAHGFQRADGSRPKSSWARAPQVRVVRPSGRGKGFKVVTASGESPWRYLSPVETAAMFLLRRLVDDGGMTPKTWERAPDLARVELLEAGGTVMVEEASLGPVGDRRAAWGELLSSAGIDPGDLDEGPAQLDEWRAAGLDARPSSHLAGWRAATRGMRTWDDVTRAGVLAVVTRALSSPWRDANDRPIAPLLESLTVAYRVEEGPEARRLLEEAGAPWNQPRLGRE